MFISVGREGIEPPLLIEKRLFYRQLGLPSPIDPCNLSSDAGGIRTRNREGLSFAAVPVRVPRHAQVVRVGLEPTNTEV